MLKDLKVVFMGTPEFSLNILNALIINTKVIGVVCQPDKLVGRKKELASPPIKTLALQNNIPVFQPLKIKKDYQDILNLKPDIIITCAYGQILPKEILDYPKYGCINVHASLLPSLRGGSPIQRAIINGDKETGITIMHMDLGMDTGDIISLAKIPIEDSDTYQTLHDKLSKLGEDLLIETLPSIITGTAKSVKQDEALATYGYNITRADELLDFNLEITKIYNKIRGLSPKPGSYLMLDSKIVKIYEAEKVYDLSYQDHQNGEIVKVDKGIFIKAKDGLIKIKTLQMEGKKKVDAVSFLNGYSKNLIGEVVNRSLYER